jgi:rhodanese-related sulfurtransferase
MSAVLFNSTSSGLIEKPVIDPSLSIPPLKAWEWVQSGTAVLIDVRSAEERKFVGYVSGSLHIPWATGTSLLKNPRFIRELEAKVKKDERIVLLCRSGKRSGLAAQAAIKAGFSQVYNVSEGFEGDLDQHQQRGGINGWRYHGLPWLQD